MKRKGKGDDVAILLLPLGLIAAAAAAAAAVAWAIFWVVWKSLRLLFRKRVPREQLVPEVRTFLRSIQMSRKDFSGSPNFEAAAEDIVALAVAARFHERRIAQVLFTDTFSSLKAEGRFLLVRTLMNILVISPAKYWCLHHGSTVTGRTSLVECFAFEYVQKISQPLEGDEVVGKRWRHETKRGERDWRYNDNMEMFAVKRYEVRLRSEGKSIWCFDGLMEAECGLLLDDWYTLTGQVRASATSESASREESGEEQPSTERTERVAEAPEQPRVRVWHEVLGVNPMAPLEEIRKARNQLVHQFHPDRLTGVDGLSPDLLAYANERLAEINSAYEEALTVVKAKS